MAYAAVISLKQTIHRLLDSSHSSILSSGRSDVTETAYNRVSSLQQVLKRSDGRSSSKKLTALDEQIREAAQKFEDVLEFQESDQSHGDDEQQEMVFFAESMKKMEEEYIKELENPSLDDDDVVFSSSNIDFGIKMVGFSDLFTRMRNQVLKVVRPYDFGVFAIVGTADTGRTILARGIYEDVCIRHEQSLDCFAWVTVGPNYQFKGIILSILAQIDQEQQIPEEDEELCEYLYSRLKGRKYVIVLDDVRDTQIWDWLKSSFSDQDNGSLVMLTTSITEVAVHTNSFYIYETPFFDIWNIFCLAIFGAGSCPSEIEETAKKIVENCEGRRLALTKVLHCLLESQNFMECWNSLAADKEHMAFAEVADEVSEFWKILEDLQQLLNSIPESDERTFPIHVIIHNVGLRNLVKQLEKWLFPKMFFPKMEIISLGGMAGIGKTTLARRIFEDPSISNRFEQRVWVTLGPKYRSEEIVVDILAEIYHDNIDKMHLKEDAKLVKDLFSQLSAKRCLIVLDDLWNTEPLHYLKTLFPDIKGELLVTTRIASVAQIGECVYTMKLLSDEESWLLLRQKAFEDGRCPPELEKAGRKIADNCEGLPLLILMVADRLSKTEKTLEFWTKVAEEQNEVFTSAHDEISKALLPSYKSLPQHLKPCFLYMGVYRKKYEIPTSKLLNMWMAEEFLEPDPHQTIENFASECLLELVDRSLVMVRSKGCHAVSNTCSLHSVFWHLSNSEAVKNNFFHALTHHADSSMEDIENQRRVCIRNSILLGIKDVHNSMASFSSARSLLCTGPPHRYPVPMYFGLRLLRVLEALTIRFYEFPIEQVMKLVHLRYLSITYNGMVPSAISKLHNLQFLIVNRHLNIKMSKDVSYLPLEIWGMKELKHLQVTGSNLPDPSDGDVLPKLVALLDVSVDSCTKRVFKRTPNLKRLGIQIELAPHDSGTSLCCLDNVSCLKKLESLKCEMVNPDLSKSWNDPRSMFPRSLKKLSLSGFGYPWKYITSVAQLPNLQVLKLRCHAFQGPEWETGAIDFMELKVLLIEDTDLMRFKPKPYSFPKLERLTLRHCYILGELPRDWYLYDMIEVVDCNHLAMTWAKQMEDMYSSSAFRRATSLEAHVHSTWDQFD